MENTVHSVPRRPRNNSGPLLHLPLSGGCAGWSSSGGCDHPRQRCTDRGQVYREGVTAKQLLPGDCIHMIAGCVFRFISKNTSTPFLFGRCVKSHTYLRVNVWLW